MPNSKQSQIHQFIIKLVANMERELNTELSLSKMRILRCIPKTYMPNGCLQTLIWLKSLIRDYKSSIDQ